MDRTREGVVQKVMMIKRLQATAFTIHMKALAL